MLQIAELGINKAKTEREKKIQAFENREKNKLELPSRPKSAAIFINIQADPKRLRKPTNASASKSLSKKQVKELENQRESLLAHDTIIPGAADAALKQVKVKSFGHIPIQARATPSWRKGL